MEYCPQAVSQPTHLRRADPEELLDVRWLTTASGLPSRHLMFPRFSNPSSTISEWPVKPANIPRSRIRLRRGTHDASHATASSTAKPTRLLRQRRRLPTAEAVHLCIPLPSLGSARTNPRAPHQQHNNTPSSTYRDPAPKGLPPGPKPCCCCCCCDQGPRTAMRYRLRTSSVRSLRVVVCRSRARPERGLRDAGRAAGEGFWWLKLCGRGCGRASEGDSERVSERQVGRR